MIHRITVHKDSRFEFELINGVRIELSIREAEGRKTDETDQNSNRCKEKNISVISKSGIQPRQEPNISSDCEWHAYCRVSTLVKQETSYEAQVNYYTEK